MKPSAEMPAPCRNCGGTGKAGRVRRCHGINYKTGKRYPKVQRDCSLCGGGKELKYCYTCGEAMPCGGRESKDTPCLRQGRSDHRTFLDIWRNNGDLK